MPALFAPTPPRTGEPITLPPLPEDPAPPEALPTIPPVVEAASTNDTDPVTRAMVPASVEIVGFSTGQDLEVMVRDGKSRQPWIRVPLSEGQTTGSGGDRQRMELALGNLPVGRHVLLLVRPGDPTGGHYLDRLQIQLSDRGVASPEARLDARQQTVTLRLQPPGATGGDIILRQPAATGGTATLGIGSAHRLRRVGQEHWTPDAFLGQQMAAGRNGRIILPDLGVGTYEVTLHGALRADAEGDAARLVRFTVPGPAYLEIPLR